MPASTVKPIVNHGMVPSHRSSRKPMPKNSADGQGDVDAVHRAVVLEEALAALGGWDELHRR